MNRPKHIGFTGTQRGMTKDQKRAVRQLIRELVFEPSAPRMVTGHHGDCIGADAQFGQILTQEYCSTVLHPPVENDKRAFCGYHESRKPLPRIDRNHAIVDECEVIIAAPKGFKEEQRSGTWATMRYAKKVGKPVIVAWPDGRMAYYSRATQPETRTRLAEWFKEWKL